MVSEVDFATDSAVGYPKFNVASCVRDQSDGNFSGASLFEINPDGTIKCLALKDHQSSVTLNPAGMWNRLSMVCITDPVNSKAIVYLYLNGEYMGYGDASNGNAATYHYFQGIRFNISNNSSAGTVACFANKKLVLLSVIEKPSFDNSSIVQALVAQILATHSLK